MAWVDLGLGRSDEYREGQAAIAADRSPKKLRSDYILIPDWHGLCGWLPHFEGAVGVGGGGGDTGGIWAGGLVAVDTYPIPFLKLYVTSPFSERTVTAVITRLGSRLLPPPEGSLPIRTIPLTVFKFDFMDMLRTPKLLET